MKQSARTLSVQMTLVVLCGCFAVSFVSPIGASAFAQQNSSDELAQEASWKLPSQDTISDAFKKWGTESSVPAEVADDIQQLIVKHTVSGSAGQARSNVDLIIDGLALGREDVAKFRDALNAQRNTSIPPDFTSLTENKEESEFLRHHVRLYLGRWLAQNEYYDESLSHLNKLKVKEVLDPPSLLFYRALMEHQLLKKDECVKTTKQLLENESQLPKRFGVLARLVLADIEPLKADSLDEISRMMGDIRRRTGLHRSGKLVIKREEEVIKKLDKLIEELEAAQKQQAASTSKRPSNPLDKAQSVQGLGSGEVKSKRVKDGGDWGDLPPAERAAALAEMAKDMPPHYRAVIEEYFRQLAKERDQ